MVELTVTGDARYRTVEEDRVVGLLVQRGWPFERRSAAERANREAAAALDNLVMLGLPYMRGLDGGRLFDPVEVVNLMTMAGLRGEDATLRAHCAPSARRLVLAAEATGRVRYAVTLRRRFNLADRAPGEAVRLRLPTPLADPSLSDVELQFLAPAGVAATHRIAPDRIDVTLTAPEAAEVEFGVRATFAARTLPSAPRVGALDPAEADLYRRASEGMIRVDDRVRALAQRLAGRETDPWAVMRRFWGFMMDELGCGAVHYDRIRPDDPYRTVLEEGWYDCRLGSALLAALCRARGLPARLAHGYLLYPTTSALHTWTEVWIDGAGWLPFDLGSWGLAVQTAGRTWRDHFFGRIDHRMAVERPPRLFGGTGDVRLPPAWQMLTALDEAGTMVDFLDLETGALVYAEHVAVDRLEPVSLRA